MAQLITVRLSRDGGSPWGFRLQGGKDFGTPLVIQKVNGSSPAERAGLIAGDSVIKVNNTDVFNLRHKDAQDVIVRAGQSFEMTVQRGGSTWKPTVTPVGNLPRSQPVSNNISPVTKTSLAAQKQDFTPIGAAHNLSPKGFAGPHVNGDGPKLVNKQYNSPIGLYSEQSIAETLSAQAEVLSTGALGVNFKKNEKNYDAEKSEVYKMLQEAERDPRTPEPVRHDVYSTMSHAIGGRATSPYPSPPVPQKIQAKPANETQGNPTCSECERLIVGVFVRIKDKNLHVECFKCATCGTSLKNVGYYNINNKLYCDIHAKLAARSNPPAPNMVPVTIPPGGKAPAGAISAALSSHSMPSPSPLSPSGNQVAAPFSPQPKQDILERFSPNNNYNPQKIDAVANLMSALTVATQKDYKENGTDTDPLYLTETIIPVYNTFDNNDNGVRNDQVHSPPPPVKYMPFRPKSASSFSGPKPFSSVVPSTPTHAPFSNMQPSTPVAAPMSNTLPRTGPPANMPERKEWPPCKHEEIPTACPLYIDPSSRIPTPQLKMCPPTSQIAPNQNPETQTPPQNLPFVPLPRNPVPRVIVPQNPHPQSNPQPALIPVTQYQNTQNRGTQIPCHQYPPPQTAATPSPASQIPIPRNPASQNPPSIRINETKKLTSGEVSSEFKSSKDVKNISQNLERNMSVCSAEFTNITGHKSIVECAETVSTAIDTQMLVNQVTRTKDRPKSPPPIQRKDSVYDTQDISIVVSTNTPGKRNPESENPVLTVVDEKQHNIGNICTGNPGNPHVCSNNPCPNICPMRNPDCSVNIITCPSSNPSCPMNTQRNAMNIEDIENVQDATNIQSTISDVQNTSNMSQTASTSKIKNPVPQEYISPMVKALTVASDRPFNTVCVEIKSKEYGREQTQEVIETQTTLSSSSSRQARQEVKAIQETETMHKTKTVQETKTMQETKALHESKTKETAKEKKTLRESITSQSTEETKSLQERISSQSKQESIGESRNELGFPHVIAPAAVSSLASALTVAPSTPFTPTPQITTEHVPLPPETTPYFPPEIPAAAEPKIPKQTTSCKSPFVDALTTASDRPYTPLVGMGQEQAEAPDYMKDFPHPSKQKMTMLSALTTATERPFTPALSVGSIEDILLKPPEQPKPHHKVIPTPPPIPLTIKPASHVSPSAFRPIGNSSFKPVIQTYVPQDAPKIFTSSTPVSDRLRSNYAPVIQTRSDLPVQQTSQMISQQEMDQYSNQSQILDVQRTRKPNSYGLHTASAIPEYQKNFARKDSGPVFVPQVQAPIQKPVTTLQPGQYQPNNHLQVFQPVRNNSPIPHSVSPSLINKPAPSLPYYQADIIAHECAAVGSNVLDPRSPAISRSPSPCPGARGSSPFPRTMAKSPAQGPPPNPLRDRVRVQQPVRDEKYLEAKENLSSYIPVYQERDEQIKSHLTVNQATRSDHSRAHSQVSSRQTQIYNQPQPQQHIAVPQQIQIPSQSQLQQQNSQTSVSTEQSHIQNGQSHLLAEQIYITTESEPIQYYSSQSQPIQYRGQPQPVQYDAQSQPTQYGTHSQPVKYSYQPQTMQYSAQSQPVQYSAHSQPVEYSDQSQTTQYSAQSQPVQYSAESQPVEYSNQSQTMQYSVQSQPAQYNTQYQPIQYSAQSQMSSDQCQIITGQSQLLGGPAQTSTKSQSYENVGLSHSEQQQQSQNYKRSEIEDVRHMEQLNKSEVKSVETSADNRIQIQRTKRCTEEYERTQKEKTIEIHRTQEGSIISSQGPTSSFRQKQTSQGAAPTSFQRQTSLGQSSPSGSKFPIKPLTSAAAGPRSYSLPGSAPAVPKPLKPSPLATTPKTLVGSQSASRPNVPQPYVGGAGGGAGGRQAGAIGVAPKRGRGVLNLTSAPGSRVPMCGHCNMHIRGPFITALGKIWCPEHFICTTPSCRKPLQDMGFVEEKGQLYCEFCYEQYLAPICSKCNSKIKGDCLNAIGKHFHPECFSCAYCSKLFGNSPFFLEDGLPYCEADWNELFTTKCFACGFPVEAGDRWVEALNNNYHSQCFNCTMCKKNLEGQSFYAKGGRPFCKNHAR